MRRFYHVLAAMLVAASWLFAHGAEPEAGKPPRPAQLEERDALTRRAETLLGQGQLPEAIETVRKMIALERQALSDESGDLADSYGWLADIQEATDDFSSAEKSRQAALVIVAKQYAKDNYRVTDAERRLALTRRIASLDAAARQELAKARKLDWLVLEHYRRSECPDAIPAAQESIEITKRFLGDEHLLYAGRLHILALLYRDLGDFKQSESLFQQTLAIEKKVLGEEHPDYGTTVNNLAILYESSGDFARAEPLFVRTLAIAKKTHGENHPHYALSLNNLADFYRLKGEYARALPLFEQALAIKKNTLGEDNPSYATGLNNLAVLFETMGDYRRAEPLVEQALVIRKKTLGENHPEYAKTLNNVATLYAFRGDFARAKPLFEHVLAIVKQALGEQSRAFADGLENLAGLYKATGMYAEALPLCRQASEILKKALGEQHPDYGMSLSSLADLYSSMDDTVRAEVLYRKALAIIKKALGDGHPYYATCLVGLAELYDSLGDFSQAGTLYLQALAIQKQTLGDNHPEYAESLRALANLYEEVGDFARAEPLQQQALAINKKALGEEHFLYARNLNIQADFYRFKGDYARAEPLYLQALAIDKKALGEEHPDYVTQLTDLALLYQLMGDVGRAEPLLKQAAEITKKQFGQEHPDYAARLNNLAHLYLQRGDHARAEPPAREALEVLRNGIGKTLPALSGAQALAVLQKDTGPDLWLSIAQRLPEPDSVLAWRESWYSRGRIVANERQRRLAALATPEAAPLMNELRSTQQQLAQLMLAAPQPDELQRRQKRLSELDQTKESLEKRLAAASEDFRLGQRADAAGPEQLLDLLPEGTVVVDLARTAFYYYHGDDDAEKPNEVHVEMRYEAFVVRAKQHDDGASGTNNVTWLQLGPARPIDEAVNAWRASVMQRDAPALDEDAPEIVLRRLVWEPLEQHFGVGKTVIVIPDGPLAVLPWPALPEKRPGSYLLDDYQITVASHGRQLIELLSDHPTYQQNLLVVGAVDYDHRSSDVALPLKLEQARSAPIAAASPSESRALDRSHQARWKFLPGSQAEEQQVVGYWKQPELTTQLSNAGANKSALRNAAPRARYLHLATHGFFANPDYHSMFDIGSSGERLFAGLVEARRSNVMARNALVLTGVVLAGANVPPLTDDLGLPTGDDGIFTAEEVVTLDLRGTELVVLSACETGLGAIGGGGEGVFGLQRAFHLSGSRNVIGSLWRVNDAATMVLMTEFYKALWNRKLSPAAALRRAQLVMLIAYDPEEGRLTTDVEPDNLDDVALLQQRSERIGDPQRLVLPPYFWSAFSFSGDWR